MEIEMKIIYKQLNLSFEVQQISKKLHHCVLDESLLPSGAWQHPHYTEVLPKTTRQVPLGDSETDLVSVIHVLIPPASGVEPDEEFPHFIVYPDQDGMGYGHKPVLSLEHGEI